MNPETNKLEPLTTTDPDDDPFKAKLAEMAKAQGDLEGELRSQLVRPDGSPVPKHWVIFTVGELVEIKDYTFKVAYIGESAILFEPVGPTIATLDEASEGCRHY